MSGRRRLVGAGGRGAVVVVAIVVSFGGALAACGSTAPGPTAAPAIGTFAEFFGAWCGAMQAMLRGVGNPDTGADSQLMKALDAAIEAGDLATAEAAAGQIRIELQNGRRMAASAAT